MDKPTSSAVFKLACLVLGVYVLSFVFSEPPTVDSPAAAMLSLGVGGFLLALACGD